MAYVIGTNCVDVKDRACIDECPVDCIYEGDRMLYIHPGDCVDCGACEPVCPVQAIYPADSLPAEWQWHLTAAAEVLSGHPDEPSAGPVPDHRDVTLLPPKPDPV
ncbi:ferredoxin [Streptomyces uncialis]|uniref:Ferredoxin n=1 Tax=Streptomyces uncialis TaxID=1048205 RepID=A0A1Q4V8V0_9ACTN|nr:ferredoxin [Streptomyces uncialis]OKH94244.1 ferredoxin [Streptomyces uncialis]